MAPCSSDIPIAYFCYMTKSFFFHVKAKQYFSRESSPTRACDARSLRGWSFLRAMFQILRSFSRSSSFSSQIRFIVFLQIFLFSFFLWIVGLGRLPCSGTGSLPSGWFGCLIGWVLLWLWVDGPRVWAWIRIWKVWVSARAHFRIYIWPVGYCVELLSCPNILFSI